MLAKQRNMAENGGVLKSDISGAEMAPSTKSKKGQKADMTQVEADHITPKSKGGTNSSSNLQLIMKIENLIKGKK